MANVPGWVEALAPAKINLSLHVTGQRGDGYHLLDSLVVFADVGDTIRVRHATHTSLTVSGPMVSGVPADPRNLVWRAADLLGVTADIELIKRLPPASGIGGGSSDAAATIRAVCGLTDRPLPDPQQFADLGADVPVCLLGHPCRMSGIGEDLSAVPNLPPFHLVLVNPGCELSTPAVFSRLHSKSNSEMPADFPVWKDAESFAKWLGDQRNDLEDPARELCPTISVVLTKLRETPGCLLSRMSGSGATCFGLYASASEAEDAARAIQQTRPDWWVS